MAPEDVETMPAATFRVYQHNAQNNDEMTRSRQRRLEEAGAFRAPTKCPEVVPAPSTGRCGRFRVTTR